jgi:hypothetical protein
MTNERTDSATGRHPNEAVEEAISSLARDLFFTMQRYDPDGFDWDKTADENWAALSDRERDFYVHAVRALLSRESHVLVALGYVASAK